MGVLTPIGSTLREFWDALLSGRSGAGPIGAFDTSRFTHKIACEVPGYTVPDSIRPHVLGGRCTEMALLSASMAVEQAGVKSCFEGRPDAALVVGTTMCDVTLFEQERAAHEAREADESDLASLARRPLDVMARSLAHQLGITHNTLCVPTACAAGSYAVGMAASLVSRGRARIALAIGCDAMSRLAFIGFSRLGAMSPDVCRPFSRGRPGLLLGEGAAALVIESLESARARGAEVIGFVDGFGLSCDAHHPTGPHPQGSGAVRAMEQALQRARVPAERVDYVNAHGTGTMLNDKVESLAILKVFGRAADRLPVSSIKALTGHMMGAAGAVEAVASLLALRHGVIPPTWNWQEADPDCAIDCVPNQPRDRRLDYVLSNSYAFGGNNASLLLSSPRALPGALG